MLYFKVRSYLMDLPADFSVELIIDNPLLTQDRIPMPYTTSFDFPLTERNKLILEQPTRINLPARRWEFDGSEMGYGAHRIFTGVVIIQEIAGRLSCNFEARDDLADLKAPMNTLDLGTYEFGSVTFADLKSPYSSAMTPYRNQWLQIYDDERAYTGAPIKRPSDPEQKTIDGDELFMNILWLQNEFFNGPPFSSNVLGLKESIDPTAPSGAAHAVMYPQIRIAELARILLKLPDEHNPFLIGEMYKLVLTSHYHPNRRDDLVIKFGGVLHDGDFPVSGGPAEPLFFNLGSFQSTVTAAEVFKSVLNMFCMTIFPIQEGTNRVYRVRYNKDVINDESFVNWDAWLGSKLSITREMAQDYVYGYSDFSERRPKLDADTIIGTIDQLAAASVDPDTGEQAYYVQTTRQLINKKLRNIDWPEAKYDYEVKYHGLEGSEAESGFDIRATYGPLPMSLTRILQAYYNRVNNLAYEQEAYLPLYSGQSDPDFKPAIMLYHSGIGPSLRPYLSYHNYDTEGNRLGNLSLAWNGFDGLIQNFHYQFKAWHEQDRDKVFGLFLIPPYQIRFIDLAQKVLVRNKLWWVQKISIPFTRKKMEAADVYLVEAPIPGENMPPSSGSIPDPGSETPDPTGTCYTITVDTLVFDPEADDFDVQLKRPGEAISVTNWQLLTQYDEGSDTLIFVCSEEAPILIQSGSSVGSVPGVSMESGGACVTDLSCVPDL